MRKIQIVTLLLTLFFSLKGFGQTIKKFEDSNYGATIERNLEAHALLDRAKDFLDSKKYQDAVLILKFIIDKFPNILFSEENRLYIPFQDKVFEIISSLPEEAKKLFLLEINSISSGMYKRAMEEMNFGLLEEIDSKYFLGDFGDDAANQLGMVSLEKGNFTKAIRYFEKALRHPQTSVNKDKLKLNLYYLYSVNGQKVDALRSELLSKKPMLKSDIDRIDIAVKEYLAIINHAESSNLGFKSLGKQFWTSIWQQKIDVMPKNTSENVRFQRNQRIIRINRNAESFYDNDEGFHNEWKKNRWYPCNNSVINENFFVLRNYDVITCYSLESAPKILWETSIEGSAKKRFRESYNEFEMHPGTNTRIPTSREEILAFSDHIGKQMVERKGVLYAISNHENTGSIVPLIQKRWGGGEGNYKVDGNFIFAVDIKSGKKMWKLGDNSNVKDPFYNAIFLNLPIETPYGLFVVYQVNNDVFAAMVTHKKEVIWKKFLCSSESTYEMPLNNAAAVIGDDYIFITIDYGVIIKLDAINGSYCWIKRYEFRDVNANYYIPPSVKNGAEINSLLFHKGTLIVLPSDKNVVYAINSETGEELFQINEGFAEFRRYLVGSDATGFYMAGSRGVVKYAYNEKKILWQSEINDNFGKGIISNDMILLPSDQNIYLLDKLTGKKISMLSLNLNGNKFPLGNIVANGSYIVSTSFDSIFVFDEVDEVISNLSAIIASNKDEDLLHRRGVLYFQKRDIEKSFGDFSKAIQLCETDMVKRNLYCESLLDVFEKIYENGLDNKNIKSMQNIATYLVDENHKSYWYYLQGEINLAANQYSEALKNYIMSFSLPSGKMKQRLVNEKGMSVASGFAALLKSVSLVEKKKISEEELISALYSMSIVPDEFILLALIEKCPSINIKKWIFKSYLSTIDQKLESSKAKSFFLCLSHSNDPTVSLSAKYYLFKQNIILKEYWSAGMALQELLAQNLDDLVYTTKGLEKLSDLISKYNLDVAKWNNVFNPAVRQITNPPLQELWRSAKTLNARSEVIMIDGQSTRPEYVEKNIFLQNRTDKKIYSCDLVSGAINWSFELSEENAKMKNDEYFKPLRVYMRMDGIGLINNNQKDYAFDFWNGKVLWVLPNEKSETLDMGSGSLIRYKQNELSVFDAFSGKNMYTLQLKEEIRKAFVYKGRLMVINQSSTSVSFFNLYTGELVAEVNFAYSLKTNFNLLLDDKVVFQKNDNDLIAYTVRDGKQAWEQNGNVLAGNLVFSINDQNILMYSRNGMIYYFSSKDGKLLWSYEVKERFKYRLIDIYPVSGNDTLIVLASSHINRNNAEAVLENTYFVIDMNNGNVLNEVKVKNNNQESMYMQNAWQVAYKGDVFPKIMSTNNRIETIKFIRIKDSEISEKHFIELNNRNEIKFIGVKGHVVFVSSEGEISSYGNRSVIAEQKENNDILAESFNEKK